MDNLSPAKSMLELSGESFLTDLIIKVDVSSESICSNDSLNVVSIRISSLNHFTKGLGFPENLTINDASCPSFTVIFSSFPDIFGDSN